MKSFTFHLLTLCHLPQHRRFSSCAFTQKNRKIAKMLTSMGHTVYAYCSEGSDIADYCQSDKLIQVTTHSLSDIRKDYGDGWNLDDEPSINYDWTNCDFRHDFNKSPKMPSTRKFYASCIEHINKIKKPDDFLLLSQGVYFNPIADAVNLFLRAEFGIGYRGSCPDNFRAFESDYLRNFTAGSETPFACANGNFYSRTIANYFDPDDVEFSAEKSDYYLFIGRQIKRKGILIADLACRHLGAKLIIAGQGSSVRSDGCLVPNDTPDFELTPGTWEYVGFQGAEQRKKLMAHAIATFVPTEYLEAFGGVHAESMLCGTPVITTDFGVFPGTVPDCVNGMHHLTPIKQAVGFRCNTLQDFVDAAKKAKDVDPHFVRKYAERYLMGNVAIEYQKWFEDLMAVYESAVDPTKKGWHRLS